MDGDKQEIIWCADDNEYRIYCDNFDNLGMAIFITIISNQEVILLNLVKNNN